MSEHAFNQDPLAFLAGGGEMGERIRAFDWSNTPLGPVESWSPALRTMLRILLVNRFPHVLWWGPQYIQFYNDPYLPIPGTKHPDKVLGRPASECWAEIWHVIGPLIDTPFRGGPPTWNDDISLELNRHGFSEETHFTIAYSPVPDETVPSGIGGVLATVHEITGKVVGERRVLALRDLAARVGDAKTAEEACAIAARTLAGHDKDVPFALLYLIDADGKQARLAGATGVAMGADISPLTVDLSETQESGWPFAEARGTEAMQVVERLGERVASVPPGPWSDPPDVAIVVPIPSSKPHEPAGLMVAGVSARLKLDALYRDFLDLVRAQVAGAIANARAYEEEKKRAEALAEIDRAKTAFFTNVSHEFRTPLTLMLGPLEDTLTSNHGVLPKEAAAMLTVAHRNSMRLLKLVNTLLDFSRIEAGRIQASFQPIDLAAVTAELASVFRAAIERAGLRFVVDCRPHVEAVYADRDMWEKIVLNLLSNAFKYTLEGEIEVRFEAMAGRIRLTVRDTGVGIPAEELPRMFERFHRVRESRGRTHEGTGIGLALVQELAKLHGGAVGVTSVLGEGSAFTVDIPSGKAHLDARRIAERSEQTSTAIHASAFVEEALRWLPGADQPSENGWDQAPRPLLEPEESPGALDSSARRPRIVWADDNADMRAYISRLLADRFEVDAVADGRAALEAVRARRPDLVLTDVMMPRLDGVGLLRELRADPATAEIPVIMLSARAGEESRVEGMQAGADDYLVKPFSARELTARVDAHVRMARIRQAAAQATRESEARLQGVVEELRDSDRKKDEFLAILAHELRNPLAPIRNGLQLMKLASGNHETVEQTRAIMERQLEHMVQLIDDLLDVSRISRGMVVLRKARVQLVSVLRNAVETSRPVVEAARHELMLDVPPEPIVVDADETRLSQVFANLLNNAAKYTEPGGRIRLVVQRDGGEVVVAVEDNGVGIPAHMLPSIFEMFTQAERSPERGPGGLGVGLTIVKRLVEMHGGRVEARSGGRGMGSQFIVRLPVVLSLAREEQSPGRPEPASPRSGRRILVVDDNRDAALTLAMILNTMGHDTQTAYDGLEALDVATVFKPDVVLLDIGMPKLSGYDACRHLRQHPAGKDALVVAVTGWGQDADRRKSDEAGFDFHLVKPVDYAAIEDLLQRSATKKVS